LASVVHELRAGGPQDGTVDPKRANAITYTLATLAAVLKDEKQQTDFEERLAAVEEMVKQSRDAGAARHVRQAGGGLVPAAAPVASPAGAP
jgi:hypothetical protein